MAKMFIRSDILKSVENLIRIFGSSRARPPEKWQEKLKREYPTFSNVKDEDLHYIRNTFISSLNNHNVTNNYERALSGFRKSLDKAKHNREMSIDRRNSIDNKYVYYDGETKNDLKKFSKIVEKRNVTKSISIVEKTEIVETIDDIFPL